MQRILRVIVAFFAAVVFSTAVACVIGTQFVLAALTGIGVDIPLADRLATTWHDLIYFGFIPSAGFGFSYALVIGIGLVIAFLVGAVLVYFLPNFRTIIYAVAGGVAIMTFLGASFFVFGVVLFAFAQTPMGLISQAVAGAIGGWAFAKYSRQEPVS